MSSPKLNDRCSSTMSNSKKILNCDSKEDSLDNSVSFYINSDTNK